MTEPTFRRYDAAAARRIRDQVALIHRDAYADRIAQGDPFTAEDEAMRRFDLYAVKSGFDLVVAHIDGEPVGQAWGWSLDERSGAAWWRGLEYEPEPGFTYEDGRRTFALSEIMVRQQWMGRGFARALHDELLSPRPEPRATLLVRPVNERAYRAYLKWGWAKAAELRPGMPHAPLFDVLIRHRDQ
ncbi:GNAT family N-acetyltransferase [Spongiactinospora gelatinilytica]|uniref:GNAT family N-acetyltransferase n=1 Tax=Spongiactinospora gelatinilytica TaxID=2666298 RepID=A0A2W2GRM0_9ACTN|nr:GNAT family N-acetyltransferase [Spongiactinospora gelatinilytica]PZG50393.1 GNAT family N-acetyltransferase [Spongiactinospora gelatinilytica]